MIQPNSSQYPDFQPGASLMGAEDASSAEYYLKLGKSLYQSYLARSSKGDLDAAIQHFQKAVEIQPELAEAYIQLAGALWDQGAINLELAQFYCETALKLDPRQFEANLYLGYFLQRAGFYDEAAVQYRQAIRKNPLKSARSRIALGNTLLKQAIQTEARQSQVMLAARGVTQFLTGCTLIPFDGATCRILKDALLNDAQVYALTNMAKGFRKIGMPALSRKAYRLGAQMMPDDPLFYHLLADEYLFELEDYKSAVDYYRKAQAFDPENLLILKKLGKAYAGINQYSEAAAVLGEVIEQDAEDFESLYHLGQIHTEEKAYFKALYYFKEAEKHRPHYPYVHSNMAYVLFKMDDVDGAFEKYKTALEFGTDPGWMSTVAQTLATISYQVYSDPGQSLEFLQQSMHYNPENLDTLMMLADLYFETGQMEMALSAYKTILQIQPDSADCYSSIGYILWQLDHNESAIDAYRTALHYDMNNPIAHNNLGVIYLDEYADPEKALPLFEKALSLKSDYTLACFNIGRALERLGRTVDAAEHYTMSLELNHFNPELDDAEITDQLDHLFS